jgi:GT2 family glycosyltransferase
MATPSLGCIIPTLNRHELVFALLDGLAAQTVRPAETIVVDQSDELPAAVLQRYATYREPLGLRLYPAPRLGSGGARNAAIAAATADVLVFLDDDVVVDDPAFLARHLARHADGVVDVVDAGYLPYAHRATVEREVVDLGRLDLADALTTTYHRSGAGVRPVIGLCGGNFSARRQVLVDVGGFDARFGLGEDRELGLRLWKAGAVVVNDASLRITHLKHTSGGLRAGGGGGGRYLTKPVDPRRYLWVLLHFHPRHARAALLADVRAAWSGSVKALVAAPVRTAMHWRAYREARRIRATTTARHLGDAAHLEAASLG